MSLALAALLLEVPALAVADHVDLGEMQPFAPPGAIDAVEQPKFDDTEYVLPTEEVIGVTIGDDARAYPIKALVYDEIVNDVVGGVPIAVTYCIPCAGGRARLRANRRGQNSVLQTVTTGTSAFLNACR